MYFIVWLFPLCVLLRTGFADIFRIFFQGGQTEVSGTLAKGRHLSFLLGTEEDARAPAKAPFEDISPTLRRMSESIVSHGRPDMAASRRASDGFTMPFGPSSTAKVEGNRGRTWGSTSSGSMSPPEQKGMKGFFASVGGAKRRDSTLSNSKQRFLAAEALIDEESRPLAVRLRLSKSGQELTRFTSQ